MQVILHLHRCAFSRQSSEADDVTEVDGDTLVVLRYDRFASDQLFCDGPGKHHSRRRRRRRHHHHHHHYSAKVGGVM